MAESFTIDTLFSELEKFEEKIEINKLDIRREFFATISPLLSAFRRAPYTEEEGKKFTEMVEKVLESLKEKDTAIKEIITTLTEEKCAALKKTKYGVRQSMYRTESTRENRNSNKDSGYHSTDSRVFTEEGRQLVTHPEQDRARDSDDKEDLNYPDGSSCKNDTAN